MRSVAISSVAAILFVGIQASAQSLPFSDNFDNSLPGEPGFQNGAGQAWPTWPAATDHLNASTNRNHTPGGTTSVRQDPESPQTLADYHNFGSTAGPVDATIWVWDDNSANTGSPLDSSNGNGSNGPAGFYFGLYGAAANPTTDTDHLLVGLNANFSANGIDDDNYGVNTESGVNAGAGVVSHTPNGTNHYYSTPVTRTAAKAGTPDGSGWIKLEVQADALTSAGGDGAVKFYIDNTLVDTSARQNVNLQYLFFGSKADTGGHSGENYEFFWYDDVSVVPEPASVSLLGLVAGGILMRRRRA